MFRPSAQLVDEQGNIQSIPMADNLPHGDWNDAQAYRAQLMSQYEQRAYDLSLWKYQQNFLNEYNSPAAQMARYGAAGLNPNLIYSQDNAASAVAYHGETPIKGQSNYGRNAMQTLEASKAIVDQLLGAYSQYLTTKSTEADIAQKQANIAYTNEQAGRVRLENDFTRWIMGEDDSRDFSESLRGVEYGNRLGIQENQMDIQSKRLEVYDQQILNMLVDMAYKNALIRATGERSETIELENGIFTEEIGSDDWWKSVFYNVKDIGTSFFPLGGRRRKGRRK